MAELREVVAVDAVRIPTGKAGWGGFKKGALSDISSQVLIVSAIEALVDRVKKNAPNFNPIEIEDVAVGCCSQIGEQSGNLGKMAAIGAGLPDDVAGWTIDRYCNSGLQAITAQCHAIMCGHADVMIAGGVESMSRYAMGSTMDAAAKAGLPCEFHPKVMERGMVIMGVSAEMVAEKYNLTREDMDWFGIRSHQRAIAAQRDEEAYKKRVIPINIAKQGEEPKWFEKDESPRAQCLDDPEAAYTNVQKLEPRFKAVADGGKVTAANSSGIVDGAAAVMLMERNKAEKLGLKPMVRVVATAVASSDPLYMLLGPVPAMQKIFKRSGLTMADMGVFEANEAFASPVMAFCIEQGIAFDDPRINPTGGAIAMGHPVGCSGALYFCEMVHHMVNKNIRYGLETLCGGGGVANAIIVEKV